MNFEPQKLFIGLVDFFSILLPGALLAFLLNYKFGPDVLGRSVHQNLSEGAAWTAFFFASYLLGHIVFLIGSLLDEIYDWMRNRTVDKQVQLLARRGRLLRWPLRVLVKMAFKKEANLAVDRATKIRNLSLAPLQAAGTINTFQWSKAWLAVQSPDSLAAVQRFEASSKFFRCLVVVLALLLGFWPWITPWPTEPVPLVITVYAIIVILLGLAFARYVEQRHKTTNQAYWSVITLVAREGKVTLAPFVHSAGEPLLAGGVVFKERRGTVKYLLVEAKNDPEQWVLPKGHREGDEPMKETAIREILEESGVWARIVDSLRDVTYEVNGTPVTVRFFLMQYAGRGWQSDAGRQHVWLSIDDAVARASHSETRELLLSAEQRRVRPSAATQKNSPRAASFSQHT